MTWSVKERYVRSALEEFLLAKNVKVIDFRVPKVGELIAFPGEYVLEPYIPSDNPRYHLSRVIYRWNVPWLILKEI